MFKRIILAIAVILPMSVFAQKFGVVDVETVFQAMPESTTMQNQLQEASNQYKAQFQQLQEELDKLYAEYQAIADDPNTLDTIKQRRISDIQERNQKIAQFQNTASQDLERLHQQLVEPIQRKMMEAIQAVGQDGDYTFILPNDQALLMYKGASVIDVTADVKAKLGLK